MLSLLNNYLSTYPKPKYTWTKVKMRYETEKAILVLHEGAMVWLPKSRIRKIKLRKGSFWIYVRDDSINLA